jgi:hypothetical protein
MKTTWNVSGLTDGVRDSSDSTTGFPHFVGIAEHAVDLVSRLNVDTDRVHRMT